MESLKGKVALITGAGSGIGRAIAIEMAKEGVNIGLLGRRHNPIENVAAEVANLGVNSTSAIADVSKLNEVNIAVAKIIKELGTVDILINNAGIASFGSFLELSPDEWINMININLVGAYYTTRAILPNMMKKMSGDIVNIASTAALKPAPMTSAYSASKAGMMAMSESLMLEARKYNIRVSCLNPSTVATEMARDLQLTGENTERVMQPEDFAEFVISNLKLSRHLFIREASIWSTNP